MSKKTPPSVAERLPVPVELIERRIYLIRGQKVILDSELAELYQVSTGNLNLAVRRNVERFPEDFMFRLTREEHTALLLQIARTKTGRGGRQTPPYVFTEHGVAMLSAVLNSERAVRMSILTSAYSSRCANSWPVTKIWRLAWRNWRPLRKNIAPSSVFSPKKSTK
jgi:hypothetical protein